VVLAVSAHIVIPVAFAGGSLIFGVFVVVLFFVVVYGYYTRRGSGINQTPYRRPDGPPELPSELAHDTTQDVRGWERGTAGHHRRDQPADARQASDPVVRALADWRTGSSAVPVLDPPVGSADHARGPEQVPSVVVYLDVSSEPCRSAYRLLSKLVDTQQIRLVVRQLPLADVHRLSLPAAEVLEAAAAQGKFFELLNHLANTGVRDEAELLDVASRHVADPDRLRLEVRAGRYRASVVEQIHQATASGAHAVPEIYINNKHYHGPVTTDDLDRTLRRLTASS
jgi:protein-disulfide isomerase